jgi:lipopolysaccharide transport system ATP-binding protein
MNNNVVIRVENLGKKYRIRHQAQGQRYVALRDVIAEKARALFTRRPSETPKHRNTSADGPSSNSPVVSSPRTEDFWALRNVSFDVHQGEVIGIIGRNGAGKSTLLKILSRITEPNEGRVQITGRVASLLEVGTGFHPELTGRENIYLNGAILGMTRAEIQSKFDEIVAFAEVEKFLDTPVKRYSSGMYVRLAFAVAAHLEPEILIVDEVLAVGDATFQRKCLGKMEKVAGEGRTVLLVSHNMSTIQHLCSRSIFLKDGYIQKIGKPGDVVGEYLTSSIVKDDVDIRHWKDRSGTGEARLVRLSISGENGLSKAMFALGSEMRFLLEVETYETLVDPCFGVAIHTLSGEPILDLQSAHQGLRVGKLPGHITIEGSFPNIGLYPGKYLISPWITDSAVQRSIDFVKFCCAFEIVPKPGQFGDLRLDPRWGRYWVSSEWKVSKEVGTAKDIVVC